VAEDPLSDRTGMRRGTDDALLSARLRYSLFADGTTKDEGITVNANAGTVTLEGIVSTESAHRKIVEFASKFKGVQGVEDRLRVMVAPTRHVNE